jgi:hypothetical protein
VVPWQSNGLRSEGVCGGVKQEHLNLNAMSSLRPAYLLICSNWRTVATGVFRGRRGCAGRMMDGSAWLGCCSSLLYVTRRTGRFAAR